MKVFVEEATAINPMLEPRVSMIAETEKDKNVLEYLEQNYRDAVLGVHGSRWTCKTSTRGSKESNQAVT